MRSGRGDERPGLARGRADRARLRSRDLRGPALSRCLPLKESGALVVFANEPRPGFVKTRMSPALSPEQAAELYAVLLEDVLAASAAIAVQLGLEAVLAVHPPEACEALAHRAPGVFRAVAQRGASLGERMAWAVTQMAAAGARRILLRGSDSPLLGLDTVAAALAALERADLVLCPDRDGGYSLVGLRNPAPGLFGHRMSTASALADTLANARSAGLCAELLSPGFDLDTAADFALLARARGAAAARLCPRTLSFLHARGLW